jgi:hypothetical protein
VNLDELWTGLLDLVSQVIIPVWGDLIAYIPLLILALVVLIIGVLAWMWSSNAPGNRSRVPAPLPAGRQPADTHLPGPSLWPFVAPVGLLLIVFAVVFGLDQVANMVLLSIGVAIAAVGLAGWYLDANREYAAVEAGSHGGADGAPGAAAPAWTLQPPAGTHLPGPSAWPLLAPAGLVFMASGLLFGPAMLIGGLVMSAIAAVGWLLDANRELEDVETHGHPTQADRDPRKAWPRWLLPVYVAVGGMAIFLTLAPWLLSLLPGSA